MRLLYYQLLKPSDKRALMDVLQKDTNLTQEVKTRFGTKWEFAERLQKSVSLHSQIISIWPCDSTTKINLLLSTLVLITNEGEKVSYPAFSVIKTCICLLQHSQKQLEACKKPTFIHVIPMLKDLKSNFILLKLWIAEAKKLGIRQEFTRILTQATLKKLCEFYHHNLWFAPMFIHPGFLPLHFMPKASVRDWSTMGK